MRAASLMFSITANSPVGCTRRLRRAARRSQSCACSGGEGFERGPDGGRIPTGTEVSFGFGERVSPLSALLPGAGLTPRPGALRQRHRPRPHDSHRGAPAPGAVQPAVRATAGGACSLAHLLLRCLPLEAGTQPLTFKDAELLRKQVRRASTPTPA